MKLVALPAFTDNYIWMFHDGQQALVVDPGDPSPVEAALQDLGLSLTAILVTHHHADHTAGLLSLKARLNGHIHGPADVSIAGIDRQVQEGDHIEWNGHRIAVLSTPGHTATHVSYLVQPLSGTWKDRPLLWCGDTLFSAGCGRIFDGTPEQLHASLNRLATLPDDTLVCCTHEYTLSNLAFAQAVEPDNLDVTRAIDTARSTRALGRPTLPSTLGAEKQINPFLRTHLPQVAAQARRHGALHDTPLSVFSALREWKNEFRA